MSSDQSNTFNDDFYTRASLALGSEFVSKARAIIGAQEHNVARRTWLDNYDAPLQFLLFSLEEFISNTRDFTFVGGLSNEQWHKFGAWFAARIEAQWQNNST